MPTVAPLTRWPLLNRLLHSRALALALWFVLPLFLAVQHLLSDSYNNYRIFRQVFWHSLHHQQLYIPYPAEYGDVNLYGPLFGVLIAPFALLPDALGLPLWILLNGAALYYAFTKFPLPRTKVTFLLLLCANELMINAGQLQSNALTAACIILGFAFVEKGKERWALFFILLGAFIKIYAVVGLVFFLFSRRKAAFIGWGALWAVVFFVLPMAIAGPHFVWQSYGEWMASLAAKSAKNADLTADSLYQNISVPGMISRVFNPMMNTLPIMAGGALLFWTQLIYVRDYRLPAFRLYILCSLLLFTVLFSSGSEACTYIVALPGMCIWFLLQKPSRGTRILFFTLWLFTTFLYSDALGGGYTRAALLRPYSLKAFCPMVLWLIMIWQVHRRQHRTVPEPLGPLAVRPIPAGRVHPRGKISA